MRRLLFALALLASPASAHEEIYRFTVTRVVDGDTFDGLLALGDDTFRHVTLRLYCINTPETRGAERPLGLAATETVTEWVGGTTGTLQAFGRGRYGRLLAIYTPDGWDVSFNRRALDEGIAEIEAYTDAHRTECEAMR